MIWTTAPVDDVYLFASFGKEKGVMGYMRRSHHKERRENERHHGKDPPSAAYRKSPQTGGTSAHRRRLRTGEAPAQTATTAAAEKRVRIHVLAPGEHPPTQQLWYPCHPHRGRPGPWEAAVGDRRGYSFPHRAVAHPPNGRD